MASKPKRRMKYPPGSAVANPIAYVIDGFKPVGQAEEGQWLQEVLMKNHSAITEFVHGRGNREHLSTLVRVHNMTRALLLMGFGEDLYDIVLRSDEVIQGIAKRKQLKNTYTLYATEITALNDLIGLHDAQMEVATIRDVNNAVKRHLKEMAQGGHIQLSTKFIGEPA